jgi:hypothetical protein
MTFLSARPIKCWDRIQKEGTSSVSPNVSLIMWSPNSINNSLRQATSFLGCYSESSWSQFWYSEWLQCLHFQSSIKKPLRLQSLTTLQFAPCVKHAIPYCQQIKTSSIKTNILPAIWKVIQGQIWKACLPQTLGQLSPISWAHSQAHFYTNRQFR